ncbi:MAG: hypothetical protein EOM26_05365 [Alphaproteobacteria bacterium]|nr:hypothetical protein [Alphaproteobacteria bacterium]
MNAPNHDRKYELFFGIIAPVGTDISKTVEALSSSLRTIAGYEAHEIHLSKLLHQFDDSLGGDMPEDERITTTAYK